MLPLCFVLMPFGRKSSACGLSIDFDAVYETFIKPSVEAAGLEPLRADEEMIGGIIHKPMFERLVLCEFAVADLTTANANVFYELGLRHAVRPWATQLLFAEGCGQLPFDVAMLRALPYKLGTDGKPVDAATNCATLTRLLQESKQARTDSPIFQLLEGFPDIQRLKTDVFRERVKYAQEVKTSLAKARDDSRDAVYKVEQALGDISQTEAGIVIDLFLSYRAVEAWTDMIRLVEHMTPPLAETVLVREQMGFALNRAGRGADAERILLDLIAAKGPSSETYGILGRVYKDRWETAMRAGNEALACGLLDKAITTYLSGFYAEWRDAFPGINAVTLMEFKEPPDPRQRELLPIAAFAVERRIAEGNPDYWDYATRLELAVLGRDKASAEVSLAHALAHVREPWESETTVRNLRLICEARMRHGENVDWIKPIKKSLAERFAPGKSISGK